MLGSISLSKCCTNNSYVIALLAGLISVLFDIILEPVAISLGYWQWSNFSPPLSNYYSWFIIVFLLTILYDKLKADVDSPSPVLPFCTNGLFSFIKCSFGKIIMKGNQGKK